MAVFRPSCQVRLQLYLDEGAKTIAPSVVKGSTSSLLKGGLDVASALSANATNANILGKIKKSLSPPSFAAAKAKLDLERTQLEALQVGLVQNLPGGVDPSRGEPVIFTAIPISASIVRAPAKDADTAQLVFAFRDLPIDPRCMRSAFVAITLGTTDRDDFELGMLNQSRRADKTLRSIVEHKDGQEKQLHTSTRFVGYVATWKVTFDDSGETVTLDCVDVSVVLRQQPLHNKKIDLKKPIEAGVKELIDSYPTSQGLAVVLGTPVGADDDVQKPTGALIPADVMPPVLRTKKGTVAQASQKTEKMTVWDHVSDVVLRLGLIPVMRHFTLYLMEPRALYRDLLNPVRMVYGNNVNRLELTRKMEGITTDTIEVRCPDRSIGRVLWARYPVLSGEPKSGILGKPGSPQPVTTRASKVTPNGTGHEMVRHLTVRGVASLAMLEKIAEATFNEIGRQEIAGLFETHEIDSFESQYDSDLLDLQAGDAVSVLIAQQGQKPEETGANTLQELEAMSVAERQRYLEGLGVSTKAASRLAVAQEQAKIQSAFRAGMTTIHWSSDDGVSIECEFYNFIVIREDPNATGTTLGGTPKNLNAAMAVK